MPMVWNDQADAKLLVAIITTGDAKLNWSKIAEYMGPECSVSAVQHRVQRLKDRAKPTAPAVSGGESSGTAADLSGSADGSGNTSSSITLATTPEKRKRGRPRKSAGTAAPEATGSGGEAQGTPSKKKRVSKAKPEGKNIKEEVDEIGKEEGKIRVGEVVVSMENIKMEGSGSAEGE